MGPVENLLQPRQSLGECIAKAVELGYHEDFKVTYAGLVSAGPIARDQKSVYRPTEITIRHFYPFERHSGPEGNSGFYLNSIVYLIETSDGRKGTLIDAYGTYSDPRLASFIRQIAFSRRFETKKTNTRKSWLNFPSERVGRGTDPAQKNRKSGTSKVFELLTPFSNFHTTCQTIVRQFTLN
ncbi:hypothetical protein BH10BAC4_BH10BAC4_21340 [soil metagenome]